MRSESCKISILYSIYTLLIISFLIFPCYVFSQDGPGGVGNSATNVIWLKADRNVYNDAGTTPASDGDNVYQWNDLSGNSKDATQSSPGKQPEYVTNIINGFPVIRFSPSGNKCLLSTTVSTGNAASLWVVASYSALPSTNPGLIQGSPAGLSFSTTPTDKSIGLWVENTNKVWGRGVQSNNTSCNISKTVVSSGTFYIISTVFNGVATIQQYLNNTAAGSVAYNGTLKSWSDFGIGKQGNETWEGDIAEIICYNIALNQAQRIVIDNYLAAKYSLTLSSNPIYQMGTPANGNFFHEVAGIGQASDASNITDSKGSGIVRINNPTALANNSFLFWGHDNGTLGNSSTDLPAGVQVRLGRIWRTSVQGTIGDIDISFDLTGLGSVTVTDLRLLIDIDNDGVFSDETPGTGGVISGAASMGGNVYKFSAATLNNALRFTIASTDKTQTPLPVSLMEYTATLVNKNDALLVWTTASEINNDYFQVDKSPDGFGFTDIAHVKGAGNSNKILNYSYTDNDLPEGTYYYRLKQVDFDGKSEYFDIKAISSYNAETSCELFIKPNPCVGRCEISFENCDNEETQETRFMLFDALGNAVYTSVSKQITNGRATFDLDNTNYLRPAVYFVRGSNNKIKAKQVVIPK